MLYYLYRILFKFSLRLFYKRVFISGLENIPKDKAIILSSNHPNAFMDAFVVGAFLPRQMSTLVRSDVFVNKPVTAFLRSFNLIPTYRSRDGAKNLKKNEKTFKEAIACMAKNHAILIFSEGTSIMGNHLLPLKKGTARLALQASQTLDKEVVIIPVGINYTNFLKRGSELMLNFDKPIYLDSYLKMDKNQLAPKLMTELITEKLTDNLNIIQKEKAPLTLQVLEWYRNENTVTDYWRHYSKNRFFEEHRIIENVNLLEEKEIKEVNDILNNETSCVSSSFFTPKVGFLKVVTQFLLLLPFVVMGFITHLLTFFIAKKVCDKLKTDIEFYSSIKLSLAMILYGFFGLLILLIVPVKYSILLIAIFTLSTPIYYRVLGLLKQRNAYKLAKEYAFLNPSEFEVVRKFYTVVRS